MEKQEFLNEYGDDYGYPNAPKNIDQIRATEFNRLTNEIVYLDHAGATLYSELQLQAVFNDLSSNLYSNPHSQSDTSISTSEVIKECRQQVLDFCNASAKEYKCIFTSGATAALKMVGEAFPWSSQSHFMYTMENHNSVIGIREYALSHGAAACAVDVEELVDRDRLSIDKGSMFKVSQHAVQRRSNIKIHEEKVAGSAYHLFAFPLECNFSGVRFNLDLVKAVREHPERTFKEPMVANGRLLVLIDAAKGCATEPPDLSKYPVDFVALSFYKIFGYPSGLGALLVRNEAAKLLKKTYFSGGTVASSIADIDFVKHRDGIEESLEDGTVSFLSIASIRPGFRVLNALTMSSISRHASSLARYLRGFLSRLKHENGADGCILYGQDDSKVSVKKGPIVSFNLKRADGSWFGYREVEKLASLSGLQIRTGCFCNPGACAKYLGLSHSELLSNVEAGHVCWDDNDIVNGKPTGAVRVSFGYMSTFEEAKKFVDFIRSSFVALPTPERLQFQLAGSDIFPIKGQKRIDKAHILKSIVVYPIKSCAGFRVDSWPLCNTGLLHDREWIIKSSSGEILTQKKAPELTLISTYIDLNQGILYVESPSCETELQILMSSVSVDTENLNISGHRYEVQCYGDEVNSWFTKAIGRPCTLWKTLGPSCRLDKGSGVSMCRDVDSSLSFVNEAQFLLVSEESVSDLNSRLSSKMSQPCRLAAVQVSPMRFRPNLIVSGGEPYAEDVWSGVRIGNKYFRSVGGCNRCQMINFDLQSGKVQKTREPLATLATYRRVKGRILFGVLLQYENSELTNQETWLKVGEEVHPETPQNMKSRS